MNLNFTPRSRAFALALTLAASFAAPALAAEQTAAAPKPAVTQSAGTGIYDQSDRFLDSRGYPLPGDEIASERDPAS
jgi:hypothetical protein